MSDPTLFGEDHPEHRVRRSDPVTSRRAAFDNAPRAGSQKMRVLRYLSHGPACANQIAEGDGWAMYPNVAARRLKDLEDDGFVERTEYTRTTTRGSQATVWRITDKGREVIR